MRPSPLLFQSILCLGLLLLGSSAAWANPDLRVTASTAPTSGGSVLPDQSFGVSFTVTNSGTSSLFSSYDVFFYYCPNNNATGCIYITKQTINNGLSIGASRSYTQSLKFPLVAAPGTRYLRLFVDGGGTVTESNENNNNRYDAVSVSAFPRPDLQITASKAPSTGTSVQTGGPITIAYTLQNKGAAFTAAFSVSFSFCTTNNASSCTQRSTQRITGGIGQGLSRNFTHTFTIPASPAGTRYIRSFVDSSFEVPEFLEINNEDFEPFTVTVPTKPDMTVTKATAGAGTTHVAPGNEVKVDYTIQNLGATVTPSFVVRIQYCTATNTCPNTLRNRTITNNFNMNTSLNLSDTVTLPTNAATGSRFIRVIVDATNVLNESLENNNTRHAAISVRQPDLRVSALTIPTGTIGAPGQAVNVNFTIANNNNGGLVTAGFAIRFFYCPNNNTTGCTRIGTDRSITDDFASGATKSYTGTLTIPTSVTTNTTGYFRARVDIQNSIAESNETNNDTYSPITIRVPDLSITASTVPVGTGTLTPGSNINVNYTVTNRPNAGPVTASFTVSFAYCPNNNDTGCVSLAQVTITDNFAANASKQYTRTLKLPTNAIPGTRYIRFVVDAGKAIIESSETNNDRFDPFTLSPTPRPDLLLPTLTLVSANAKRGLPLGVRFSLQNAGTANATNVRLRFYLSQDATITTADTYLQVQRTYTLSAGATLPATGTYQINVTIPANAPLGAAYIGAIIDDDNKFTESDETNNTKSQPTTVQEPKPDLVAGKLTPAPTQVRQGGTFNITYEIENTGDLPANSYSTKLYFSTDTKVDANDTLLQTFASTSALPTGGKKTDFWQLQLPANLTSGAGYILMFVDWDTKVDELDETNNVSSVAFTITAPPPEPKPEPAPEPIQDTRADAGTPDIPTPDAPTGDCTTRGCPSGQLCKMGLCVPDPCQGVSCTADQACRAGKCEDTCGCLSCPTGKRCALGQCIDDLCLNKQCPSGEVCQPNNGNCIPDKCQGVTCKQSQVCDPDDGMCIDDPCNGLRCPSGMTCKEGQCIGSNCSGEPLSEATAPEATTEPVTSEPVTEPAGTSETGPQDSGQQEPVTSEPNNTTEPTTGTPDAASTDRSNGGVFDGGNSDQGNGGNPPVGGGCCQIGSRPQEPLLLMLFLLLLFLPHRLRRRS